MAWAKVTTYSMKELQNVTKQADNEVKVAAVKGSDGFEKEKAKRNC